MWGGTGVSLCVLHAHVFSLASLFLTYEAIVVSITAWRAVLF